ncbi:sugar transferase [Leptolyngbya sp. 7M]|uniref:sugar transferase n=1 Tax=Leptolyngbya sp. 7M TaxID=2812896 RepID=UPI001B8BFBD2|nr:sugar transferase [Leptolyngbya sp. 7M]QYO65212.1 sugar transferase [Leptolyngbya sp. 7M]
MYASVVKRIFDIVASLVGLIILGPLMIVVAILIKIEDGGNILFRQTRIGKNSSEFTVYKFRSMPMDTPNLPSAFASDVKITQVGRFIRRTNIDELPQLFNVLKGDMSIVGPRPPIPSQTELCLMRKKSGADRCLPGITGLAQINGYDHMPETEKAEYDTHYAENVSLLMDLKIILRTFPVLTRRPPVY